VWWDGDQSLVEERTPEGTSDVSNSGTVGNIHALVLDEPLAVITTSPSAETRIINYNWRGQGMGSVYPSGHGADVSTGFAIAEIDWPASTQAQTYFTPSLDAATDNNPKKWLGTFIQNGMGTTGMLYRRNRYFDTNTGRFTQEDPIGITGGVNQYGFAQGDPVNFSDPFGLCTPWPECLLQNAANWGATRGGSVGSVLLNVAAGANAASEAFGINAFGKAIAERDGVNIGLGLASFVPAGRVLRGSSLLVRGAAEALATRIGENSVTVVLENGFKRIDLIGRAHAGIPTPHVHWFEVHTDHATGLSNLKKTFGGAATRQDIIDAARATGQIR
jgi:RHS repeat-associated protein